MKKKRQRTEQRKAWRKERDYQPDEGNAKRRPILDKTTETNIEAKGVSLQYLPMQNVIG